MKIEKIPYQFEQWRNRETSVSVLRNSPTIPSLPHYTVSYPTGSEI